MKQASVKVFVQLSAFTQVLIEIDRGTLAHMDRCLTIAIIRPWLRAEMTLATTVTDDLTEMIRGDRDRFSCYEIV